jgi:hypothetical protein
VTSADHWDAAYARGHDRVSWFEAVPSVSLELIEAMDVEPSEPVVDAGGGGSFLADELVARGYADVTILDLSAEALAGT